MDLASVGRRLVGAFTNATTTAADEKKNRAAGGGGVRDAPRLHEHVSHLGQVGGQILRLRIERVQGNVGQGYAVCRGREPRVEAAARRRNRRRNRAILPMSLLSSRSARAEMSSRARTVFEGVIFFALASAFIALRVSLSPFASRYASTAGTRSAALALIATVGGRLRRAATRCEPSPKPWRRFREERTHEKALFCSRFVFPTLLHAYLVLHKVKSKMRDCSHGKRLSGKPEDVAARRALRAFDSAVGIAPRVKVRVFPEKGAVDLTFLTRDFAFPFPERARGSARHSTARRLTATSPVSTTA